MAADPLMAMRQITILDLQKFFVDPWGLLEAIEQRASGERHIDGDDSITGAKESRHIDSDDDPGDETSGITRRRRIDGDDLLAEVERRSAGAA